MILIDNNLMARQQRQNPIKVGIIGAGVMATGVINQISKYTPGIMVSVIYNRNLDHIREALQKIGVEPFYHVQSIHDLNRSISTDMLAIVDDIDLLLNSIGLDVLIELTGSVDFAADTILKAFARGKNVLSFNAELEATLGYLIHQEALKYNVRYGLADGDQPSATLNLYRFVKQMGLTPLVCGNIKGLQDKSRTPLTQQSFASQWDMSPHMVTSFADGTKISFEQACIANATGMSIARRGMIGHQVEGHVDDFTHLFDLKMLEQTGGIVDYLVGAKPGPGVFIYAKAPDDPFVQKYLKYMKLGPGPLYCFYTPYHLLFLEIPNAICRIVDFEDTILTARQMKVEVITMAKTNLKKGDVIDAIGGFKTYGVCETFEQARSLNLLPMGLAQGAILHRDIGQDHPVALDDIDFPENKLSVELYYKQLQLIETHDLQRITS